LEKKLPFLIILAMLLCLSVSAQVFDKAAAAQASERQAAVGSVAVNKAAGALRKVVRVGYYEDNSGFQLGFADNQRKSGYAYEYYQEIAKYAGWDYKYVYGSWNDLYVKLLSGDVDIMAGVSKTDERIGKMLYPDNVMGTESYYVFVPVDATDIKNGDVATLNGKRIGVNANSLMLTLFSRFVADNHLNCEIRTFDGHASCAAALKNGAIDGYVITDNYVVDGVKPVFKIGASNIYFAIAKGRRDLLSDVNDAQNQILAAEPYYGSYLQAKYFNHSILRQALTDRELSWLHEKGRLKIGYIDGQLPYCGTDSSGECAGLIRELKEDVAKFLKIPVQTSAYAGSKELLAALKVGEIDAAFPVYGDTWSAEQEGVYLTREVVSDRMGALYTGEYAPSLLAKTAAPTRGLSQRPYLAQYYPDSAVVDCEDLKACMQALKSGKVTSVILNNNIIQRYLSENEADAGLHVAYLDSPASFCIAVSKNGTVLQSILNKAITNIDSSSLADAITRNTYGTANYSFGSFLRHNVMAVIMLLAGLLVLITAVFIVYRTKSEANNRKLKEANQAKSEFLSRMSHDIRTPMNAIVNLTALARSELDDPRQLASDLGKIAVSGEFLLGLINDILDMARIESNKMVLTPGVYSFAEFESYLEGVIRPLCEQKQIAFTYRAPGSKRDILTDRIRFNQIFFNILSNAVKYTDPGGKVDFLMENSGTGPNNVFCTFVIRDSGRGMSEEFLKHVYQPFERADNTEAYSGTGLGLSITKSIVEAMNGTIELDSRIGEGTTVTVKLPLLLATQQQSEEHQPAEEQVQTEKGKAYPALNGIHVLIAEDNPLNLEIVERLLRAEGVITDGAPNGAVCAEKFEKSPEHFYAAVLDGHQNAGHERSGSGCEDPRAAARRRGRRADHCPDRQRPRGRGSRFTRGRHERAPRQADRPRSALRHARGIRGVVRAAE
jgi:signal transduction histidine kinase